MMSCPLWGVITWTSEEVCNADVLGDGTTTYGYFGDIAIKYDGQPRIVWSRSVYIYGFGGSGAFYRYRNADGSWSSTRTLTTSQTKRIRIFCDQKDSTSRFHIIRNSYSGYPDLYLDYYVTGTGWTLDQKLDPGTHVQEKYDDPSLTYSCTATNYRFAYFGAYGANVETSSGGTTYTIYLALIANYQPLNAAYTRNRVYFSLIRDGSASDFTNFFQTIYGPTSSYWPCRPNIIVKDQKINITWMGDPYNYGELGGYANYWMTGTESGYIDSPSYSFGSASEISTSSDRCYYPNMGLSDKGDPFILQICAKPSPGEAQMIKYDGSSSWENTFTYSDSACPNMGYYMPSYIDPYSNTFAWAYADTSSSPYTYGIKVAYYVPSGKLMLVESAVSGLSRYPAFIAVKRYQDKIHLLYGTTRVTTPKIYYVYGDVE